MKEWHLNHTQNLEGRIPDVKGKIAALDIKGEDHDLIEEEVVRMNSLSNNLVSLNHLNSNIRLQQSRLNWLKEGDANTRFLHGILASRRLINSIVKINVNGGDVEGLENFRGVVFNHFQHHFQAIMTDFPGMEGLTINVISESEKVDLVRPFSLEEVKQAMWNCDSFNSPGPNRINLGFIKEFWQEIKEDLMRLFMEFHRNGKFL